MIVKLMDETYDCIRAVRKGQNATLFLSDRKIDFTGINDFSIFELSGGNWEDAEPTESEKLRIDVDELQEALNLILSGVTD